VVDVGDDGDIPNVVAITGQLSLAEGGDRLPGSPENGCKGEWVRECAAVLRQGHRADDSNPGSAPASSENRGQAPDVRVDQRRTHGALLSKV
jgi:hypothetical protein